MSTLYYDVASAAVDLLQPRYGDLHLNGAKIENAAGDVLFDAEVDLFPAIFNTITQRVVQNLLIKQKG